MTIEGYSGKFSALTPTFSTLNCDYTSIFHELAVMLNF